MPWSQRNFITTTLSSGRTKNDSIIQEIFVGRKIVLTPITPEYLQVFSSFKPYKLDKPRGSSSNSRKQANITENAEMPKYLRVELVRYIESFEGAWKEYFRVS